MDARKICLLLVDDDPSAIQLMGKILARYPDQRVATSGEAALRLARDLIPDLILLDAEMPGMSGFEVFRAIKAEPAMADVPVIFVTSHDDVAFEVAGLEMGAADFITKPVNPALLLARVQVQLRVKGLADEVRRISTTDSLTGLANRRWFDEWLDREWLRGRRANSPLSLLMIDVDHFKLYNDRFGHPMGDDCLRHVAKAVSSASLRPADLAARHGGEEFALLLPETPCRGAQHIANRILESVNALSIPHPDSLTARHVTVSVGIGCCDDPGTSRVGAGADHRPTDEWLVRFSAGDLVQAADKALYAAKRAGRAQARMLSITNVDAPHLARDITPSSRRLHGIAR